MQAQIDKLKQSPYNQVLISNQVINQPNPMHMNHYALNSQAIAKRHLAQRQQRINALQQLQNQGAYA